MPPILQPGARLSHYVVDACVGRGGGAEVFRVTDTRDGSQHALKLDKKKQNVGGVAAEARVLAELAGVDGVLQLTGGAGADTAGRAFLVAELLAPHNLAQAARSGGATPMRPVAGDTDWPPVSGADADDGAATRVPRGTRWTAADARAAAAGTLAALRALHDAGFLHRDVKPSNFGRRPCGNVVLFDLGLAVPWRGGPPPLPTTGKLTGSATYASPSAHEGRALGRRDDVWGWLFLVAEQWAGTLPWRSAPDRAAAAAAKRAVLADPAALGAGAGAPLPPGLAAAARHAASLGARDTPDYDLLAACVADLPTPLRCAAAEAAEAGREGGGGAREGADAPAARAAQAGGALPAVAPPSPPSSPLPAPVTADRDRPDDDAGAATAAAGGGAPRPERPTKKRRRGGGAAAAAPPRHHRPPPPQRHSLPGAHWRPPPPPPGFKPAAAGFRPGAWPAPAAPPPPPPPPHGWAPARRY